MDKLAFTDVNHCPKTQKPPDAMKRGAAGFAGQQLMEVSCEGAARHGVATDTAATENLLAWQDVIGETGIFRIVFFNLPLHRAGLMHSTRKAAQRVSPIWGTLGLFFEFLSLFLPKTARYL